MVDLPDARRIHEAAERAAKDGDLASAEELLRQAAHTQEAELGALHPDLANTLNNLAIVTEKAGRLGEAEAFYRRASAIASASLPADHPMVAASRQNLEDFCRARGLPIEPPAPVTAAALVAAQDTALNTASDTSQTVDRKGSGLLVWIGLGVVVVAAAALMWPLLSSREPPTPVAAPAPQPTAPEPSAPAPSPPAAAPATPAPVERPQRPTAAPRVDDRDGLRPSTGAVTLATAQLCQTFAINGASWQCKPAGDSVSPGPVVLVTRVRSTRDAAVVHRWYRGDTLRQSVKLTIRANPAEGYRTYSRQTVNGGAEWRVEVRSADGELLHEQRFAVR